MGYPFYQEVPPLKADISVRDEVKKMLYGDENNRPIGTWAILRRLQRDNFGEPILSKNVDFVTDEPDLLNNPSGVTPEGYLYNDKPIRIGWSLGRILNQDVRFFESGMQQQKKIRGFFAYDDEPKEMDQLFMLKVDEQGNPVNPFQWNENYIVATVFPHIADMGRVEFWLVLLERYSHRGVDNGQAL